jgi:hypothetical protein
MITASLNDTFQIYHPNPHRVKAYFSRYYEDTFTGMLDKLKHGYLIHIDETTFSLKDGKSYVWVFTSIDTVCYLYRPNREAGFLKEMFADFKGVLIVIFILVMIH